jgi:RNA recognition motif-containing protein
VEKELKLKILVRNLFREVTEKELLQLFLPFGKIKSLNIVTDKLTGKSKGFGFVDMPEASEAAAAIKTLNGKIIHGEKIRVKTATQEISPFQDNPDVTHTVRFEVGGRKKVSRGKSDSTYGAKSRRTNRKEKKW